ncbi:Tubby-like F-box protein 5 [Orobanche minor]
MSFKSIVRELKEMKDGFGSMSWRGVEGKHWRSRTRSFIAPDVAPCEPIEQGQWANLLPELLLDIIRRVEESETAWPARTVVVFCASVCRSWRDITREIVKTPEECGRLTFPISLKQPGPRDAPIQCFIKRDRTTSTYRLYFGLMPSAEDGNDKLLLAAKRIRRPTATDFLISLVASDFSRASNTFVGKIRSNFLGTKFTIYDSQPPAAHHHRICCRQSRRFNAKQVSPRLPAYNYSMAVVSYELNILRTRGPRRMCCAMHSIPVSSIQEGGMAPTPTSFPHSVGDGKSEEEPVVCSRLPGPTLVLKNKSPRWHEQLQCWCLNFKGRVTVASVKNFQLVAAVDEPWVVDVPTGEQEKVMLQFGKIGKDIFTMDYRYPLSAFQAFGICLSSFDTKPACE